MEKREGEGGASVELVGQTPGAAGPHLSYKQAQKKASRTPVCRGNALSHFISNLHPPPGNHYFIFHLCIFDFFFKKLFLWSTYRIRQDFSFCAWLSSA